MRRAVLIAVAAAAPAAGGFATRERWLARHQPAVSARRAVLMTSVKASSSAATTCATSASVITKGGLSLDVVAVLAEIAQRHAGDDRAVVGGAEAGGDGAALGGAGGCCPEQC